MLERQSKAILLRLTGGCGCVGGWTLSDLVYDTPAALRDVLCCYTGLWSRGRRRRRRRRCRTRQRTARTPRCPSRRLRRRGCGCGSAHHVRVVRVLAPFTGGGIAGTVRIFVDRRLAASAVQQTTEWREARTAVVTTYHSGGQPSRRTECPAVAEGRARAEQPGGDVVEATLSSVVTSFVASRVRLTRARSAVG